MLAVFSLFVVFPVFLHTYTPPAFAFHHFYSSIYIRSTCLHVGNSKPRKIHVCPPLIRLATAEGGEQDGEALMKLKCLSGSPIPPGLVSFAVEPGVIYLIFIVISTSSVTHRSGTPFSLDAIQHSATSNIPLQAVEPWSEPSKRISWEVGFVEPILTGNLRARADRR